MITDLGMPYVDGRKVASAVKTTCPSTPVILLTGWGQRIVAEGDVPPHVNRVLSKPRKLRELRAAQPARPLDAGPADQNLDELPTSRPSGKVTCPPLRPASSRE